MHHFTFGLTTAQPHRLAKQLGINIDTSFGHCEAVAPM
jgi:hypothetical protein